MAKARVIDLSRTIEAGPALWPGDPDVTFERVAEIGTHGFHLRRFCMGEHAGTHANAPAGFHEGGAGIDAYPASAWIAPAAVIDFRDRDADARLEPRDIIAWEARFGRLPAGTIVLLNTGRAAHWFDRAAYLGWDADGSPHWPGFGSEAIELLLDQRGIAGVGTDAAGVDAGDDTAFRVNRRVLDRPRVVLECLADLTEVPPTGATLHIGVLKLKGGTGSPASVMALIE